METKIVDARGLACPLPVVNAKKAVGEFQEDGVLTVLVDNEIAVQNLAAQRGLSAAGEKKADKEYEVKIQVVPGKASASQKKEEAQVGGEVKDDAEEAISCSPDSRKKGMVVVLSANTMGNGEEKLGKALMKAFVL